MLTFTVTRDPSLLSEEDIYHFLPLGNLKELLKEENSLCLVRNPEWCEKPEFRHWQALADNTENSCSYRSFSA